MQNLKSYRENNPGKGYWDWKVEAFQGGGEIGNEERQYLHSWYTNRREYAKRHMPAMLKQLDDADIYIDPNSRIRNIYSTPITISNDKIKQASKDSGIGEYGGYYHPNEGVVLPSDYKQWKDREPLLHELNHVVNTFNSSIFDQVNKVLEGKQIIDRGQEVNNYLTTPSEVQSRLMEFRKLNNLDPTKVYGIPDVREWRRTGKDADLLNTFDDDTVLELINTVAHTPNKKVQRAADGGVNDNLIGSYSNHTGTPTMYVPVTKEYEAVPEGFGEIVNVHTPEVTITPQSNISLVEAVDKGRRDAAPYVGAIVAGATLPAMSSTNMLGKAIDLANIVLDPTNPANYVKIPNIRLGRWSAKFPEYGNQNKAFRQVNVDAVDDYINTGVVGPESKAHNAMRSAQNANKNSGGGSKHLLTLLTKHFDTHVMFNKTKPFYGKDSKYPRVLVGDLRNPRINWKKVNHKGHKNIVEPVDPSAGNFTVPIEEFDIWRKAKIGWLRDQKANRFADGGQTGDPEKERFYQATGRSSSGRPLEEGLKPVFSLEDAANMTPIGDAISAKDAYDAVKNKDWLGAGLAASAMIPFIPNVYRSLKSKISREVPTVTRSFQRQVDANDLRRDLENNNRRRVLEEYSDQRNRAYELLNTPEARRRAQIIDRKYGTEYNKVYDDLTKEYEDINSYVNLPEPNFVSNKKDYANIDPSKSKIINLSTDNIRTAEDYPKGLIRHEIGHYVDEKAYPGGVPNNAYLRQLGKPSKYRSFSEVEHMFPDKGRAKSIYEYLRRPTEKKSIMNQFDEYLMNTLTPSTYPTNTKQFRQVIESAPDLYNNMKMLLKIHTKPSVLYKDFLARPLVNKINKNKNQEIV